MVSCTASLWWRSSLFQKMRHPKKAMLAGMPTKHAASRRPIHLQPCQRGILSSSSSSSLRNHSGAVTAAAATTTTTTTSTWMSNHQQQQRDVTTIAILKETYNVWERRAPLTPTNVRALLDAFNGPGKTNDVLSNVTKAGTATVQDDGTTETTEQLRVLVEPCTRRIFSNEEYERAGAIIASRKDGNDNDDDGSDPIARLDDADVFLSVKRPQGVETLLPDKTYMFFSHTIKGQDENMPLLKSCLEKRVQLFDYERMMHPDDISKRLVSFGKYAGIAATIDSMSVLGKRLLYTHGINSVFLSCPPSWQYDSIHDAKTYMEQNLGRRFHEDTGHQLPEPLVFAVTGQGGAVHGGVMEMLTLLPHRIVSVRDLPYLNKWATTNENDGRNQIYIVPVNMEDVFVRCDGAGFDRGDFKTNPLQYRSLFAQLVAPYVHVIYNCAYWDPRFPRLLSKAQIERLYRHKGDAKLMIVADISCDVNGSMEFLDRTTTIESPCFQYDPTTHRETANEVRADGVTVMGVDILPTELPRDSSEHFGCKLVKVLTEMIDVRENQQDKTVRGIDPGLLSPSLAGSCITAPDGTLSDGYRYLDTILKHSMPRLIAANNPSMMLSMEGHLFDSGLINQILDVIELNQASARFEECVFPPCPDTESKKSSLLLKVIADDQEKLEKIESKILALVDVIEKAQATVIRVDQPVDADDISTAAGTLTSTSTAQVTDPKREKRVLLLGSGLVSKSTVQYLGRSDNVRIIVASDREDNAKEVAAVATKGQHVGLDVSNDVLQLSDLVEDADLVISLLPAPMHPVVAQECILHKSHLVTASYESDEMREMGDRARDAGIVILNEVGLDPGLDHMSAMRIIDDIKHRGGTITGFSSVCGGLPAPECANNPLQYKFSWSPRGVIRASQNPARYRRDGKLQSIVGRELLQSAQPFMDAWPDLRLECLPNRDSLMYETVYDIQGANTVFRGTLRYDGFSSLMNVFMSMGLFDDVPIAANNIQTWADIFDSLRKKRGGFETMEDFVEACANDDVVEARRAIEALEWLGVLGTESVEGNSNQQVVDAFCQVLEQKLCFEPNERDMVVMHHSIQGTWEDGTVEDHSSSLQVFGDSLGSAMSKTVGFTTAASAEIVLDGTLAFERGLLLPINKVIYEPVLAKVEQEGIVFNESVSIHLPPEEQNAS